MNDRLVKLLSAVHTAVYRATGGAIGRRLVGNDMLLLTTSGRETGSPHTVPLLYLEDGDRYIVIASYGGRPHHPDWYRNLMANPEAHIRIGDTTHRATARTMGRGERSNWWPRVVDAYADYENYQGRTDRLIPIVVLEPVADGP